MKRALIRCPHFHRRTSCIYVTRKDYYNFISSTGRGGGFGGPGGFGGDGGSNQYLPPHSNYHK